MVCLWEAVRFSRLSSNFLSTVVENSPFLPVIKHTASYSYRSGEVEPEAAATSKTWSRHLRRRGRNLDLVVAHCDGLREVEFFNTTSADDEWQLLTSLPSDCGNDGVAIAGYRSKVFFVGGGGSGEVPGGHEVQQQQPDEGRGCFIYDLEEQAWSRGPSLQQRRWHHGLARIGDTLYAISGCGQQNSVEAVSLADLHSGWSPRPPLEVRRHVPGVGVLDSHIYVVGGSDSVWNAQTAVERFDPVSNEWTRLPDLLCPRAQPAVASLGGQLYVIGGRNSKKVEIKSVEVYNPVESVWTLLDDTASGCLRKKRWASAAVSFRDENILVIGGRGRWAASTVEVFCPRNRKWQLAVNGVRGTDKRYTATIVSRPTSDREL